MTVNRDQITFRVPLTDAFHQAAQGFRQHHTDRQKGKQVYLNTLSVQVVHFYLACLGIAACLEKSESWHPVSQALADTADLWITDLGRLECRPVLPEVSTLETPPEVWGDRIGYVFVQFDSALREATILGFLPQITGETIFLEQLQGLEALPDYLEGVRRDAIVASTSRVTLRHWLVQVIAAGWQTLDVILAESQRKNPALSFRAPTPETKWLKPVPTGVKQGKFLTLSKVPEERILFIVGITPTQKDSHFNIAIEIYPAGHQTCLPPTLQMVVTDAANTPVLQAEGRQSEGLEFQFSGEAGEKFNVQLSFNQFTVTEQFEI
ncbi:MAG: DUF1822 family protein [Cyanobacteria bacterium P01_H01_bin.153]